MSDAIMALETVAGENDPSSISEPVREAFKTLRVSDSKVRVGLDYGEAQRAMIERLESLHGGRWQYFPKSGTYKNIDEMPTGSNVYVHLGKVDDAA